MPTDVSNSEPGARAKLFRNGRSQAVRLPKKFRFEGEEVSIRRDGAAVILEPIARLKWPRGYWQSIERNAKALNLGTIRPLGAKLLDITEDEI
ncbi:MAG: antitoxin [Acidobacteriota bacterium]